MIMGESIPKQSMEVKVRDLTNSEELYNAGRILREQRDMGEITKGEYRSSRKELYLERSLQRGAQIVRVAETLYRENPTLGKEDLIAQIKQFFVDGGNPISEEQE